MIYLNGIFVCVILLLIVWIVDLFRDIRFWKERTLKQQELAKAWEELYFKCWNEMVRKKNE